MLKNLDVDLFSSKKEAEILFSFLRIPSTMVYEIIFISISNFQ